MSAVIELNSQIAKQILQDASAKGVSVEIYLRKLAENTEDAKEEIRLKRMNWLKSNQDKYGGQFVVLDGDKLLGVAKSFLEGKKIATESGVPDAFVNYLSKTDEEGYLGGW